MKKYIRYLFLIIIIYSIFILNCYASTNTYVRTDNDLKVPSDVIVDSNNHDEILSTPSVSASEKIYDYAEILSEEEEKKLYNKVIDFNKNSNFDAVIVTTNDLGVKNLEKYTYNFYDYNDFGKEGVIFVIDVTNSSKPSIFIGICGSNNSEVFEIYNNKIVNQSLKYLYDNSISKGNYYEACFNFVKIVNGLYIQKKTNNLRIDQDGKFVKVVPIFEVTVIALAVTFIIMMVMVTKVKSKSIYRTNIDDKVNKSTLIVECEYDKSV